MALFNTQNNLINQNGKCKLFKIFACLHNITLEQQRHISCKIKKSVSLQLGENNKRQKTNIKHTQNKEKIKPKNCKLYKAPQMAYTDSCLN